jgi:hypothetical protein
VDLPREKMVVLDITFLYQTFIQEWVFKLLISPRERGNRQSTFSRTPKNKISKGDRVRLVSTCQHVWRSFEISTAKKAFSLESNRIGCNQDTNNGSDELLHHAGSTAVEIFVSPTRWRKIDQSRKR